MKTHAIARCAAGCPFMSTIGGACGYCAGPLAEPQTGLTAPQTVEIIRNDAEYQAGKAATLAWLASVTR